MKRRILFALMITLAVTVAQAQDYYVYESLTNHNERSSYQTTISNLPPSMAIYSVDYATEYRYRIYVTKAQYDNGWGTVPQADKDAALAACMDELADYTKFDGNIRAVADALYDEINVLRTDPKMGLPALTDAEKKQKIKDKSPTKDEKNKPKKPKK